VAQQGCHKTAAESRGGRRPVESQFEFSCRPVARLAAHLNAPSAYRGQPQVRFQGEADMDRQASPAPIGRK
jgi:hypothetical protein